MTTPVDERPEPTYAQPSAYSIPDADADLTGSASVERPHLPSYNINNHNHNHNHHHHHPHGSHEKTSDEEGTVIGDGDATYQDASYNEKENAFPPFLRPRAGSHLTVSTQYEPGDPLRAVMSSSQTREQANRLNDDLAMLKVERQISRIAEEDELSHTQTHGGSLNRSKSRKRAAEHVDEFDVATNPVHEQTQVYKPVENPSTGFAKFVKRVHGSNFLVRYFTYIVPVTLILLIPLLLGALLYKSATVGGVYLLWFMIWLEIVWLTLWAGRILAKMLPVPIGLVSSLFTNNSKKWRDMGKQLELPATLFFWWLAIEVSFLPTMTNHQTGEFPSGQAQHWMATMNKVLVSLFVGAILNFVEKIIIQLIAISFHLRTYADRIELNKFQIGSLAKLYKYSKEKIAMDDREFENQPAEPGSGARTPGAIIAEAAKTGKMAFSKFGDVAGKIAGDFTGRAVVKSTHPQQVILTLISSTTGAQVLARRLYRTFAREETETVIADDLRDAFENDDEADAAFTMFDKDMNGDISMEELEAVCVEIGRERKSITASLKDLDSVVGKLDDVFMFIVFVITVLVFISLISTSAAGVLTSAGSAVLALSWLFSATAQEFLQSCIFVFVKHPFDVGDRVTVYGNAGSLLRGDDFFVKEISLLYTEFKKMEGHIVQAPNSYLNTLFILNQRRSGGLAEAVSITIKFGTTLDQIEGLRNKLLEFVKSEKREYQSNILTELRDINEVHSMNMNVIFFYKSNWQNEGLRLARRNKFICAMMVTMQELGIEGPQMRYPGQRETFPVYLQNVPHVSTTNGHGGNPDNPMGVTPQESGPQDPPFVAPMPEQEGSTAGSQPPTSRMRSTSVLRSGSVMRRESLAQMNRRVDFSLGARDIASGDLSGDVYDDRVVPRVPIEIIEASRERANSRAASQHPQPSISRHAPRASNDIVRTSSRDSGFANNNPTGLLARRSTDSASGAAARRHGSVHRNRFFGRSAGPRPGPADEANMLESGMADIPENPSGTSSAAAHLHYPHYQHQHQQHQHQHQHLDPRSGLISPTAWRVHSSTDVADHANLELPAGVTGSGALGDVAVSSPLPSPSPLASQPEGFRRPGRAATEGGW